VTITETPGQQFVYPTPPGSKWRLFTCWRGPPPNRNNMVSELSDARARKLHFDLYGAATASCDLDGHSPQAAGIQELSQDLMFWRFNASLGQDVFFRGVIGHSEDSLDGTAHIVNVQAADYRAVLGRVVATSQSFTAAAQESIVYGLVTPSLGTSAYPANMGIQWLGVVNPDGSSSVGTTPTTRTIAYVGTEQVGAEVDKLATMQGGFDWGCEPNYPTGAAPNPSNPSAQMYLWYPSRGVSKPFIAEYGTNVTAVKRTVDSTGFSNWVQYTGTSGTAAQVASGDVMANPQLHAEGLWQETKADANVADTSQLLAEAQYDLGVASVLTPSYTLTLAPGAWKAKTDCWLGDTIRVRVTSGRLAVDINVRIVQVDITIDDAGNETIALTVARPPQTLAGVLGAQNQNLYQLNRR
jgi:hypothetical protein